MIKTGVSSGKAFLAYVVIIFLILTTSIVFGIPVLRQVSAVVFLTFVPGWIILRIIKLHKLGLTDKFVLSVGLSVAFILFVGLIINTIYPIFGYNTPLATNSILFSFFIIILILAIIAYFRNKDDINLQNASFNLTTLEKWYLLLPATFPLLSILSMRVMNTDNNNIFLMVLLLLIPAYSIFIAIVHKKVPDRVYAPTIFCISIALILLLGLRSNHLLGQDIHTEYYIFKQTLENGKWQILMNSTLDSCLSISILPVVYQQFININSEYLYKILYSLLFSISPLIVFLLANKYVGKSYSFLAALFFMSQFYFLNAEQAPRTIIALIFFSLSILVLWHDNLTEFQRRLLFLTFSSSCVISHYATTYIFFISLVLAWIFRKSLSQIIQFQDKTDSRFTNMNSNAKNIITFWAIALLFVLIFLWYEIVTGAAFKSGVSFIAGSLHSVQNFFDTGNRDVVASAAFGANLESKTVIQQLNLIFSWLTIVFIAVGVLSTMFRLISRKYSQFFFVNKARQYLSQNIENEYFMLSVACSLILALAVALPFVLKGYDLNRTYIQMIVILSTFFLVGGITIAKLLHVRGSHVILLFAVIPYFLFNTGTMYQIFGRPYEIILNSEGQDYEVMYVHEQESVEAKWLKIHINKDATIFSDWVGIGRLLSQGEVLNSQYSDTFIEKNEPLGDGYFHLGYTGVIDHKLLDKNYLWHDFADYDSKLLQKDLIYSNGGSRIYR